MLVQWYMCQVSASELGQDMPSWYLALAGIPVCYQCLGLLTQFYKVTRLPLLQHVFTKQQS